MKILSFVLLLGFSVFAQEPGKIDAVPASTPPAVVQPAFDLKDPKVRAAVELILGTRGKLVMTRPGDGQRNQVCACLDADTWCCNTNGQMACDSRPCW